jgi:hypothetical protein
LNKTNTIELLLNPIVDYASAGFPHISELPDPSEWVDFYNRTFFSPSRIIFPRSKKLNLMSAP